MEVKQASSGWNVACPENRKSFQKTCDFKQHTRTSTNTKRILQTSTVTAAASPTNRCVDASVWWRLEPLFVPVEEAGAASAASQMRHFLALRLLCGTASARDLVQTSRAWRAVVLRYKDHKFESFALKKESRVQHRALKKESRVQHRASRTMEMGRISVVLTETDLWDNSLLQSLQITTLSELNLFLSRPLSQVAVRLKNIVDVCRAQLCEMASPGCLTVGIIWSGM